MANPLANTTLQTARSFMSDTMSKKFEQRKTISKILPVYTAGRESSVVNLEEIRQASTQTVSAMYLSNKDFTLGTAKSCSPSGETGSSAVLTPSWQSLNFEVVVSHDRYQGNEVAQARGFANDLYQAEASLWFGSSGVESVLLAHLESNKSGTNSGDAGPSTVAFQATPDLMEMAQADKARFYNYARAHMAQNNFTGTIYDVHDMGWSADWAHYTNQGAGNDTNDAYQFAGFSSQASNLLDGTQTLDSTDYASLHYLVPEGGVAILDWNDPKCRKNMTEGDLGWTTYRSMFFPEFTFDVYVKTACADTSSDGGTVQDLTTTYEFTLNFAPVVQPSNSNGPVYKYGVTVA